MHGTPAGEGAAPTQGSAEYTVIVLGAHGAPARQLHLDDAALQRALSPPPPPPPPPPEPVRTPRWPIVVAGVGLALAATGAVLGLGDRGAAALLRLQNHALSQENDGLRQELAGVEQRLGHIASTLTRVEAFDARLRGASTGLEPPAPPETPDATSSAPTQGAPSRAEEARPAGSPASKPPVTGLLDRLDAKAREQEDALRDFAAYFDREGLAAASGPSIWPTRGFVTSDFGVRVDPYTAERMLHRGLDIAAPIGQPVYAPSDGTVVFAGVENGYGKTLLLDHGNGVRSRYGHLSQLFVKRGDHVTRGERIGAVGSTGRSTGPHLHYEVRIGDDAENPREFIQE